MIVIVHNDYYEGRQVQIDASIIPRRKDLIALPDHWRNLWLFESNGDLYRVHRVVLTVGETGVLDTAHVYVRN